MQTDMYLFLPSDIRLVVFDFEHEMGITVGGGVIFTVSKANGGGMKNAGRTLHAEESFVRLASMFVASNHLHYSDSYLARKFRCNASLVHYAKRVVRGYLETNPRYRRKIYTVAIKNGLMELADEINMIEKKREAVKNIFN